MGDEKFVADSMVDIIRGIVREEINKTDSTLLCRVKNIYSKNAVDVIPVSDKTLILHNIPNMTKYDLNIGDYVYIYRVNNQLDNSFVCYVLGKNPIERSYNVTGTSSYTADAVAFVDFVPKLVYNSEDDTLSISNYVELAASVEKEKLSLDDLEVGIVVKKHSRSGTRYDSGSPRKGFPSLDGNKATSWGGMFVHSVQEKFFFSMEEDGLLRVSVSHLDRSVEDSSFTKWISTILPTGKGSTGASPLFAGFKYYFLGLKFRIGEQETQYSENSLAFSAGDRYLSDDWEL